MEKEVKRDLFKSTFGILDHYEVEKVFDKIETVFVFKKGLKLNYVFVSRLIDKDPFTRLYKNIEKPGVYVTDDNILKVLGQILKTKNHKGCQVFQDWMAYAKYIDMDNMKEARGKMALNHMAGGRETEFHFHIKPYKSLQALKYQYNNRIESRKATRQKQMVNKAEINEQRLIISVIEDYEREIKAGLEVTGKDRLIDDERDNANQFLIWLDNEKGKLIGKIEVKMNLEKIKWLGSPEQFGYIFGELVAKGYIELPTRQTEGSIPKLAEICLNYFQIPVSKGKTKGQQTTKENLERALNLNKNTLSVKGKATINLPQLNDLK